MQFNMTVWSRDWESFDREYIGKNSVAGLSDEEFMEYLRWMACTRPEKYAYLMTAFMEKQSIPLKAAVS